MTMDSGNGGRGLARRRTPLTRLRERGRLAVTLLAFALASAGAAAQDAEAEASIEPATPASIGTATRAPGDEVMRPTARGFRLTPGLVRAITDRAIKNGMSRHFGLDEEAAAQAAEIVTRNVMETAHKYGEPGSAFFEFAIETMIRNNGPRHFTPESAKRWAELNRPIIPAIREFAQRSADELEPLIPEDRREEFREESAKFQQGVDLWAQAMDRWAAGGYREGENAFQEIEDKVDERDVDTSRPREVQQAERRASYQIDGTRRWKQYARIAAQYYDFDSEQVATANAIVDEMMAKAEEVQTPEWKQKAIRNRVRHHLGLVSAPKIFAPPQQGNVDPTGFPAAYTGDVSQMPWFYALNQEFKELMQPIADLEMELKERLMAVATPDQVAAAEGDIRTAFAELGYTP
jgi:hypothetical protein